jgi:predicted enzyme related to lactoylglutathione lyase
VRAEERGCCKNPAHAEPASRVSTGEAIRNACVNRARLRWQSTCKIILHALAALTTMAAILVNIDVPELEPAIAFYTRAFGLQLARRLGPDFAELVGAQAPIYLLVKGAGTPALPGRDAKRSYARHWTPVHLDFVVPDIEVALAHALEAGAKQESAISDHAYGKLVLLSDPYGHGACLLQFNARGYDAIAK